MKYQNANKAYLDRFVTAMSAEDGPGWKPASSSGAEYYDSVYEKLCETRRLVPQIYTNRESLDSYKQKFITDIHGKGEKIYWTPKQLRLLYKIADETNLLPPEESEAVQELVANICVGIGQGIRRLFS